MTGKQITDFPFAPRRSPVPYGWFILAVGTLGVVTSSPGQTMGISPFNEPLMEALGLGRSCFSLAYGLGTALSAMALTFIGKLYDRLGARVMGFAAAVMLALVLFGMSRLDHIASWLSGSPAGNNNWPVSFACVLAGFFLLRLAGPGMMTMVSSNMVMKWFDRRRGLACGIMNSAISLSFSCSPLLFHWMASRSGWSETWAILAMVIGFGFTAVAIIFFRDNPAACGLEPDAGMKKKKRAEPAAQTRDFTLSEACRTYAFWIFTLAIALDSLCFTGITFNVESVFENAGRGADCAFSIFPLISFLSVPIGLLCGWLSDFVKLKYFLILMMAGMSVALAGLMILSTPAGYAMIVIGNGVAGAVFVLLLTATWPRFYGVAYLGEISGFHRTLLVAFSASGPFIFGASRQYLGSYHVAAAGGIGCAAVLAVAGIWADGPSRRAVTP